MSAFTVLRCTAYTVIATAALACGDRAGILDPQIAADASASFARKGEGKHQAAVVQRSSPLSRDLVTRATITPRGGVMTVEGTGLVVLFPPGAVTSDLAVSITANRGKEVVYSFEPHGVQFARPISIGQLLSATKSGKKGETAELYGAYLARGLADIDALGVGTFSEMFRATLSPGGAGTYVVFQTTHFSGYALASGLIKHLAAE